MRSQNSTPSKVEAKSGLRLVSYHDDTVISDDDDDDHDGNDDESTHPDDVEMDASDREMDVDAQINNENEAPTNELKRDRFAEYGFSLPPEPKGKCPQDLQDKITKMYEKMRTNNMDMNKLIQERKEFRNPSIYEKLIQFCDIDELGTNYPPEIYDPAQWTSKYRSGAVTFNLQISGLMSTTTKKKKIVQNCLHPNLLLFVCLFNLQIQKSPSTKSWQKSRKLKWTNEKKN